MMTSYYVSIIVSLGLSVFDGEGASSCLECRQFEFVASSLERSFAATFSLLGAAVKIPRATLDNMDSVLSSSVTGTHSSETPSSILADELAKLQDVKV